jgi:hypothetical protein
MEYDILDKLLSAPLFQAVFVAVVSVYLTIKVQEHSEHKKTDKELRFDMYGELMNLNLYYGFLAGYEIRGEKYPQEMEDKVRLDRFNVSDLARKIDSTDLNETLQVLFLEKYTYRERYHATTTIIDSFGYKLAPNFKKMMRSISEENEKYLLSKYSGQ